MAPKRELIFAFFLFLLFGIINCQEGATQFKNEINVVHGSKHVFTIETPAGWINDKALAQQFGLPCFFYPIVDTTSDFTIYMYALGIDKREKNETLTSFIQGDLKKFEIQYPDYKYDTVSVEGKGGIIDSKFYTFYNLDDRYKEEVLYSETDSAFVVLSFTAKEQIDYEKYLPAFDLFVSSFIYRGSNPESFLKAFNEYQNE